MRILFVIDALRKGGIRTSLLNLLANLNYDQLDVSLFCFHLNEEDKDYIPSNVHVISPNKFLNIAAATSDELKQTNKINYFIRKTWALLCHFFNSNNVYNHLFKTEKRIFNYDIAISFTNNVGDHSLYFGCNKFVIEKVKASKKLCWIHADYEKMKLNTKINNKEYSYFNKIIFVSDETKKSFLKYNPELSNKTAVIYNLINEKLLDEKANFKINETITNKIVNLITIARLDYNKDPYKIIEIANYLKSNNFNFLWRVIGDGPLLKEMRKKTKDLNLNDVIHWYGYLENPYPYLSKSNLYISTSKSEGYSLAIVEALYFKVPILCGYYRSVNEIISPESGWIVENDAINFNKKLNELLSNKKTLTEIRKKIKIQHDNKSILKKFNEVLYEQI